MPIDSRTRDVINRAARLTVSHVRENDSTAHFEGAEREEPNAKARRHGHLLSIRDDGHARATWRSTRVMFERSHPGPLCRRRGDE